MEDNVNLDNVFENITKLYNKKILSIVYNCLLILDTSEANEINHVSNGLQEILKPQHLKIKTWIRENLTC